MRLSDEAIIERCLEGDGNAFSQLVEKYQNAVYGLCYHIVGNFADAQDLTQETFVRAYLDLPRMRDRSKFASWLHRITANTCKMWLRDRKGTDDLPLEAVDQAERDFAHGGSPQDRAEAEELRLSITEAIASLSEKNRLAVTLYYIDGLSYDEIGDFLSLSTSAVKSRLHRARTQLKEELISMVEDNFDKHKLPEDFPEKVIQEVEIKMVKMGKDQDAPIVILQNKAEEGELLPIWIGMFEALAIITKLENQPTLARPQTHDLMANMLKELGMKVVRVVVTDLKESTYYARITIQTDGKLKEIDARPSDSIALALRTGAPIFVAKSVLSESGIRPDDKVLDSIREAKEKAITFHAATLKEGKLTEKLKDEAAKVIKGVRLSSMFELDPMFQDDLDNGKISDELRQAFDDNGIPVSDAASVSHESSWQIKDGRKMHLIKKEAGKLNVYSSPEWSKKEKK
jgi:RNA polymerase sigma factor (sigma-70 family)